MVDLKECRKCGETKPLGEFYRDRSRKDGRGSRCRECHATYREANRDRIRERTLRWQRENREKCREFNRRSHRKHQKRVKADRVMRRFGLTLVEYDKILARGCALCGDHDRIGIDHDHTTGRVRDALCGRCNSMLGMAADSPERLEAGAAYLRAHCDLN